MNGVIVSVDIGEFCMMVVVDVLVDVGEDFFIFGWFFVEFVNVEVLNVGNDLRDLVDVRLKDVVKCIQSV